MKNKDYLCRECANTNCLIHRNVECETMQSYIDQKSTFTCKQNQQFILEGAPVNGLYFIYDGSVKVYKQITDSDSQIIRFSKNGEIVGHRGFGTSFVYDISASALTDTVLCHFATPVIVDMLHQNPPLMYDVMLFYADQLQKSEANARRFTRMSVRDKVINGLVFIYKKFGQTDGFFNITLSRKDIADFAGTSQEQAIRMISSLKKEGLLVAKAKRLGIPDLGKIESGLTESGSFLEG
jgi:cAMP-binding proteins - catabolite gene activator and regulatory subunit of cAMP-dependent protein kinases